MFRTATRPRHLALLAAALGLAATFAWLGDWQLQRSRVEADARAAQSQRAGQPATDLLSVLPPATPVTGAVVGRTVTVTGRYDPGEQLLVDAGDATWVLTPLLVDTPDGRARLPVVRGATGPGAGPADVPPAPTGTVRLTGRLEAGSAPTGLAPGADVARVDAVSPADLANVWGTPLWTAYLAVTEPVPPAPLVALPEPDRGGGGLELRNLSYALQWWVFAGFAVFVWWRVVAEAHRREAQAPRRDAEPDPSARRPPVPGPGAAGEDDPVTSRTSPAAAGADHGAEQGADQGGPPQPSDAGARP